VDTGTGTDSGADSGTDTSTDTGADTSTGTDTGADSDAGTSDTATEVLSYRAATGYPADQGWTRTNGTAEVTDDTTAESGKALRMSKASDAGVSWMLTK
ncbi:TPA: hypothetical protein IGZ65_005344, partial [Escherichia coli]|nr:hypothetical protein [Escherichia coli]